MNRAARRYLLARVSRMANPFPVVRLSSGVGMSDAISRVVEDMMRGRSVVLPDSASLEIVTPKPTVRVVAGKGGRRRGVRGSGQWAAPRSGWKALAVPYLFKRWSIRDPLPLAS